MKPNASQTYKMLRYIRYTATSMVLALALAVGIQQYWKRSAPPPVSSMTIGGSFTLLSHQGKPYSSADLRGKPYAIFFGFTHCPNVCPTTLFELSERLKELDRDGLRIEVLFVTVDPERDTPDQLKLYLESFDPRIVGLTGNDADVEKLVADFRAYRKKVPLKDGDYTMDHTAIVCLFGSDGLLRGTLDRHERADIQREKLLRVIIGSAGKDRVIRRNF